MDMDTNMFNMSDVRYFATKEIELLVKKIDINYTPTLHIFDNDTITNVSYYNYDVDFRTKETSKRYSNKYDYFFNEAYLQSLRRSNNLKSLIDIEDFVEDELDWFYDVAKEYILEENYTKITKIPYIKVEKTYTLQPNIDDAKMAMQNFTDELNREVLSNVFEKIFSIGKFNSIYLKLTDKLSNKIKVNEADFNENIYNLNTQIKNFSIRNNIDMREVKILINPYNQTYFVNMFRPHNDDRFIVNPLVKRDSILLVSNSESLLLFTSTIKTTQVVSVSFTNNLKFYTQYMLDNINFSSYYTIQLV